MNGRVIRVGLIGLGRSGRDIHGRHLASDSERYRIVAVADSLEERRRRAESEWGCASCGHYRDFLERHDLDLVVNASPSHQHAPISLELLQSGYDVLCEKPLARTLEEVDALCEACRRSGKSLAVFQNARFAPCFQQIRQVIASGVLGRVVQISIAYNTFTRRWDWQTLQECYGGSLMNTGPHPLDQALALYGEGMPQVSCYMDRANTSGDAEDYVKILLSGPGHPVVDVEISSCCAYPPLTYRVQGTYGGLQGSKSEMEWRFYSPSDQPQPGLVREPLRKADGTPAFCTEELHWHTECWQVDAVKEDPFAITSAAFYAQLHGHLTNGEPLEVPLSQVRRQVAVMEECRRQNQHIYSSMSPKGTSHVQC